MHFVNLCTQNIKYVVWKYAVWDTPFAYAWLVGLVTECVNVQLRQGSLTMQFLTTTKIYAPATAQFTLQYKNMVGLTFLTSQGSWISEILRKELEASLYS